MLLTHDTFELVYWREKPWHKCYTLLDIKTHKQWVCDIPDTINVSALSRYQRMNHQDIPLLTLVTGNQSVTYTIRNWFLPKSKTRYTFYSKKKLRSCFYNDDISNQYAIVTLQAHLVFYEADQVNKIVWKRTSNVFIDACTLLFPKKLYESGSGIRKILELFKYGFSQIKKKNKLEVLPN
jgi:hypothetical protein